MRVSAGPKTLLLMGALLVLMLAGCVEYDERIEINPDGKTGTFKMHIALAEQMLGLPQPVDGSLKEVMGVTEEDLRKQFDSDGMEITDIRVNATGGMRHLYLVCKIKDVSKLAQSPALADREFSLKKLSADHWKFSQKMVIEEGKLTGGKKNGALEKLKKTFGEEEVKRMMSKFSISFSFSAPEGFQGSTSEGEVHRENTVIWSKRLDELMDSDTSWKMEADFVKKD